MKQEITRSAKEPAHQELNRRLFLKTTAVLSGAALGATGGQESHAARAAAKAGGGAIYITDLSHCEPRSALSHKPQRHRWRLLDYETETLKGTMLTAGQNTQKHRKPQYRSIKPAGTPFGSGYGRFMARCACRCGSVPTARLR